MKFYLTAINAKYIHSNPAVYSLAAYAERYYTAMGGGLPMPKVEIGEYTINQSLSSILTDIYQKKPDVLGISCYIWNIHYVIPLVTELHKILPNLPIWLGGPEVTYEAKQFLEEHPEVTGIMVGEGEKTFTRLLMLYKKAFEKSEAEAPTHMTEELKNIPGIVYRTSLGEVRENAFADLTDLSDLPFLYRSLEDFENKIIYYETSRGCPFSCSYCLSSIDKKVRFRDIEIVKQELQFFLDQKVKQVKFIDRTFNCSHKHAMEIWQYIKEHDNGITNFHFEIAADILNEEEIALVQTLRPGAIQMEIGVQSTNPQTIREIDRVMDVDKLAKIVENLHAGHNIHLHLDLIAGLPYEDYESFKHSFNEVFAMKPEQLQLGFLKVLKGSKMYRKAEEYGIRYLDNAPYEVLFTKWLSYADVIRLKQIEEMVEIYYNSNQFTTTLPFLYPEFETPFAFFEALADYYEEHHFFTQTPARIYRYQILLSFAEQYLPAQKELIREMLIIDFYLRENAKTRPDFAEEKDEDRMWIREFYRRECEEHTVLTSECYREMSPKVLARAVHVEPIHFDPTTGEKLVTNNKDNEADAKIACETSYMLFDYANRDPLTYSARIYRIQ